jgi:hypothetical protein
VKDQDRFELDRPPLLNRQIRIGVCRGYLICPRYLDGSSCPVVGDGNLTGLLLLLLLRLLLLLPLLLLLLLLPLLLLLGHLTPPLE